MDFEKANFKAEFLKKYFFQGPSKRRFLKIYFCKNLIYKREFYKKYFSWDQNKCGLKKYFVENKNERGFLKNLFLQEKNIFSRT